MRRIFNLKGYLEVWGEWGVGVQSLWQSYNARTVKDCLVFSDRDGILRVMLVSELVSQ